MPAAKHDKSTKRKSLTMIRSSHCCLELLQADRCLSSIGLEQSRPNLVFKIYHDFILGTLYKLSVKEILIVVITRINQTSHNNNFILKNYIPLGPTYAHTYASIDELDILTFGIIPCFYSAPQVIITFFVRLTHLKEQKRLKPINFLTKLSSKGS